MLCGRPDQQLPRVYLRYGTTGALWPLVLQKFHEWSAALHMIPDAGAFHSTGHLFGRTQKKEDAVTCKTTPPPCPSNPYN